MGIQNSIITKIDVCYDCLVAKDEKGRGEKPVQEQRRYLRAATEAMKTTSEVLKVALSFPPLRLVIISIARQTAHRMKCQGE